MRRHFAWPQAEARGMITHGNRKEALSNLMDGGAILAAIDAEGNSALEKMDDGKGRWRFMAWFCIKTKNECCQ